MPASSEPGTPMDPLSGRGRPGPLVSVIIPVYNAQAYLAACVGSILAQTHEELQIILVDDGSTDASGRICDELASEDDRVEVVHQPNGGIAVAQNTGLDRARGALITFCDNDDLMDPRMIARLVQILEDGDADMSCCRWRNVGASRAQDELRAHEHDPLGESIVFTGAARAYQLIFSLTLRRLGGNELRYFSEANWGKLYRRELFDGIRFPSGRYAQDVAVAMQLYRRMTRVASCGDALYYWLQRGDSVSHGMRSTSYYHDIVTAHAASFDTSIELGILPARAYTGLRTVDVERRSIRTPQDRALYESDRQAFRDRLRRLTWNQRVTCRLLFTLRMLEVKVYNVTIHRRR
ncbi:glycosyltransferase family 2 protein [Microbacterium sp.]|uniref:glycosyltransferase family 2 protein n=1 Tax=Microbacterium sp. TaxID=51671 RepID=UPI0039E46889